MQGVGVNNWHRSKQRRSQHPLLLGGIVAFGLFGLLCFISVTTDEMGASPRPGLQPVVQQPVRCVDRLPDCAGLAARGECDLHPELLHASCPVACGLCVPANGSVGAAAGGPICQDHAPDCDDRARAGECAADPTMQIGGLHGHLRVRQRRGAVLS